MSYDTKSSEKRAGAAAAETRPSRIRNVLIRLVLACLLPGMIGATVLFLREYRSGQEQLKDRTLATARALTQAVDTQLLRAQVLARALTTAGSLASGDLQRFHKRSKDLLELTKAGTNIVLSDASGQQLVNTLREYGEALPKHGNPEALQRVFATGKNVVSSIYIGGLSRKPVMSIEVPVFVDGKVAYDLSIGLTPAEFSDILSAQNLPPDWVAAIIDESGTIVARTHLPEKFVGQPGTPEFIRRIRETPEGTLESTTREGIPVLSIWSRSPATGWTVGIGIPRANLEQGLIHTLTILGLGMAALLAVGLALAWGAGQRIAHAFHALTGPAAALGEGETARLPALEIREADDVARAINRAADLLHEKTAALRATFEQAAVGIAHASTAGRWLRVNDKLCAILGYEREALLKLSATEITYAPDLAADLALQQKLVAGEIPYYWMEKRYVRVDGTLVWVNLTVSLVRQAGGAPDYFVVVVEDIQARKEVEAALDASRSAHEKQLEQQVAVRTAELIAANRELESAVRKDTLTGLQNRISANERLRQEFLRMKRTGDQYAVLFLDIDHFKAINDTYGHETGDQVLKQMAAALAALLRASDFVARFGGEEFLAVLPSTGAGAGTLAEKIRRAIAEQSFPVAGRITVSIGVACANVEDANEDAAVRRADAALYQAKRDGRNAVRHAAEAVSPPLPR